MAKSVTDEEILRLWKDPHFSGAFRGVKTFQTCLKLEKDIDISERRLYKILKLEPIFLIHQKSPSNLKRRHLNLNNYGELVFGDIAYMYDFNGFKYFLLLVDGFSSKIFVRPLKTKDSAIVAKALEDIFEEFNSQIYVFETDRGSEFKGPCKALFKKWSIVYKVKFGANKAFMSENYIKIVKRKLYMSLRGTLSQDWIKLLEVTVNALNNTPTPRIGYLTPNSIKSEADSVKVAAAKSAHNIESYKEDTYKKQLQNQSQFDSSKTSNLRVNDYVYLDFNQKVFDKSFDVSVSIFYNNFIQNFNRDFLLHAFLS
jgi:hypothetical protein